MVYILTVGAQFHFILEKAHIRWLYICNFSKCQKYLLKVRAYTHMHTNTHTLTHTHNAQTVSGTASGLWDSQFLPKLALPSMSTCGWPWPPDSHLPYLLIGGALPRSQRQ